MKNIFNDLLGLSHRMVYQDAPSPTPESEGVKVEKAKEAPKDITEASEEIKKAGAEIAEKGKINLDKKSIELSKLSGKSIQALIKKVLGEKGWKQFKEDYSTSSVEHGGEWQAKWMMNQKGPEVWDKAIKDYSKQLPGSAPGVLGMLDNEKNDVLSKVMNPNDSGIDDLNRAMENVTSPSTSHKPTPEK